MPEMTAVKRHPGCYRWVNNTRRYAARLDDETDALLAQLTLPRDGGAQRRLRITWLRDCTGLAIAAHLLTTLCGNEEWQAGNYHAGP